MTVSSVGAAARQHASLSVVSRRAGLITVKPCPSRRAGAFTRKRMAAHGVGGITGAVLVTDEAVQAWRTESLLAIRAFKPCFTQTGSIDMVTLGSILTLTPLVTLRTIAAHRTVILTSASTEASCALALPRDVVAQSAVTTGAVFAAVDAVLAKRAGLGTN